MQVLQAMQAPQLPHDKTFTPVLHPRLSQIPAFGVISGGCSGMMPGGL